MRYRPDPEALFIEEELPVNFPCPTITMHKDRVVSFNKSYRELIEFSSIVCGTTPEKLCGAHLMFCLERTNRIQKQNEELKKDLLWALENSSQFDWNNKIKSSYVDRWFPELKDKLPIRSGGSGITPPPIREGVNNEI